MIELDRVWKRFGGIEVLRGVSLVARRGRATVLIGPSGCGKSTMLRLMLGLTWTDAGAVRFDGRTLAPPDVPALRQKVGYVIQQGGLFPHLTARGNVALMARHLRWGQSAIAARVAELAERTQLARDTLDRYPAELSGG